MSASYKATGINLKGVPMGENDRLLTVLTAEYGLIRAIAPGSRKHESSLRGRSGVFVVNHLLLIKGKSLDKIIQAESIASYPGLSQDLGKLTAAQYLAELVLYQAMGDQPQSVLFGLIQAYLSALEGAQADGVLPLLVEGMVTLLRLAGVAPEVNLCAVTRQPLRQTRTDGWQVGFHPSAGGVVSLAAFEQICDRERRFRGSSGDPSFPNDPAIPHNGERFGGGERFGSGAIAPSALSAGGNPPLSRRVRQSTAPYRAAPPVAGTRLTAAEWQLLRQVATRDAMAAKNTTLPTDFSYAQGSYAQGSYAQGDCAPDTYAQETWLAVERSLRYYAQYHFERLIQSASLIDACFAPLPSTLLPPA